jgi:hypothetical protein
VTGISFLWALIISKAAITPLTYDEAASFLEFNLTRQFFSLARPNNHPLNTALMAVATIFREDEFLIRLPNALAGAMYLIVAVLIARRTQRPLLSLSIMTFSPYLLEFFALARGYGLAASLVMLALGRYFFLPRTRFSIVEAAVALLAASLAFYPAVVVLLTFVVIACVETWRRGERFILIAVCILSLVGSPFPIWALKTVTEQGKVTYGWGGALSGDLLTLGIGPLFSPAAGLLAIAVFTAIASPLLLAPWLSVRTRMLAGIAAATITVIYVAAFLGSRPLPIGRVLIPFLPILLLASVSAWDDTANWFAEAAFWVSRTVVVLMAVNLILSYRCDDTYDWHVWRVDPAAIDYCGKPSRHPSEVYYRRQAALKRRAVCALE